jgi:hypothetical protein
VERRGGGVKGGGVRGVESGQWSHGASIGSKGCPFGLVGYVMLCYVMDNEEGGWEKGLELSHCGIAGL